MAWWIIVSLLLLLFLALVFLVLKPFAPKLSDVQENFIAKLNPAVQGRFRKFIAEIESKGHSVEIASCHRGWAKSVYIWQTDAQVQRCCQPGRDFHYMGLACDLVIHTKDGKRLGNASSRADWESSGVPEIAKKYGLQWGGMQNFDYWDPVHFAYTYDINQLVDRVTKTCGGLEGDCGNTISLLGINKT